MITYAVSNRKGLIEIIYNYNDVSIYSQVGTYLLYSYLVDTISMKKIPDVYNPSCPTRLVLDRIADKWTVLIIGQLSNGTLRFNELKRSIPGVTQKMLTQTLKGLERDGVIIRKVYAAVPPKVEYTLTKLGKSLISVVEAIRLWSEAHIKDILTAQEAHDSARAGTFK